MPPAKRPSKVLRRRSKAPSSRKKASKKKKASPACSAGRAAVTRSYACKFRSAEGTYREEVLLGM